MLSMFYNYFNPLSAWVDFAKGYGLIHLGGLRKRFMVRYLYFYSILWLCSTRYPSRFSYFNIIFLRKPYRIIGKLCFPESRFADILFSVDKFVLTEKFFCGELINGLINTSIFRVCFFCVSDGWGGIKLFQYGKSLDFSVISITPPKSFQWEKVLRSSIT